MGSRDDLRSFRPAPELAAPPPPPLEPSFSTVGSIGCHFSYFSYFDQQVFCFGRRWLSKKRPPEKPLLNSLFGGDPNSGSNLWEHNSFPHSPPCAGIRTQCLAVLKSLPSCHALMTCPPSGGVAGIRDLGALKLFYLKPLFLVVSRF